MPAHRSTHRLIVALLLAALPLLTRAMPTSAQEAAFAPGAHARFFPVSVISTQPAPAPTGLVQLPMDPGDGDGGPPFSSALIGGMVGSVVGLCGGFFVAFSDGGDIGFSVAAGLGTALGATWGKKGFFPALLASSLMVVPTLRMAADVSSTETGFWLTYAGAQGLVAAVASQYGRR